MSEHIGENHMQVEGEMGKGNTPVRSLQGIPEAVRMGGFSRFLLYLVPHSVPVCIFHSPCFIFYVPR